MSRRRGRYITDSGSGNGNKGAIGSLIGAAVNSSAASKAGQAAANAQSASNNAQLAASAAPNYWDRTPNSTSPDALSNQILGTSPAPPRMNYYGQPIVNGEAMGLKPSLGPGSYYAGSTIPKAPSFLQEAFNPGSGAQYQQNLWEMNRMAIAQQYQQQNMQLEHALATQRITYQEYLTGKRMVAEQAQRHADTLAETKARQEGERLTDLGKQYGPVTQEDYDAIALANSGANRMAAINFANAQAAVPMETIQRGLEAKALTPVYDNFERGKIGPGTVVADPSSLMAGGSLYNQPHSPASMTVDPATGKPIYNAEQKGGLVAFGPNGRRIVIEPVGDPAPTPTPAPAPVPTPAPIPAPVVPPPPTPAQIAPNSTGLIPGLLNAAPKWYGMSGQFNAVPPGSTGNEAAKGYSDLGKNLIGGIGDLFWSTPAQGSLQPTMSGRVGYEHPIGPTLPQAPANPYAIDAETLLRDWRMKHLQVPFYNPAY